MGGLFGFEFQLTVAEGSHHCLFGFWLDDDPKHLYNDALMCVFVI